jgi:hypothetical protein
MLVSASLLLLLLLLDVKPIIAEDPGDSTTTTTIRCNDNDDDEQAGGLLLAKMEDGDGDIMIIKGLMIFFGVCLAFIATALGLLQLLQHSWIAEYRSKGRTVTASVHDVSPTTKCQTITATIDYPYADPAEQASSPRVSSCYTTTIRKQIKCCQEDLVEKKSTSGSSGCGDTPDCCLMIFEDGTFSFDEALFHVPAKLSLHVVYLPDYPHSALPKSQVASTSIRQLGTAVPVVATLLLLSTGCIHLGIRRNPLLSIGVVAGSCLLCTLLLYHCIRDAMEHEYTESDGLDADTLGNLSTMASDSLDQVDCTDGTSNAV